MNISEMIHLHTAHKVLRKHRIVAGFYTMVLIANALAAGALFCGVAYGQIHVMPAIVYSLAIILCTNMTCGRLLREIHRIEFAEHLIKAMLAEWSDKE